MQNRNGDNRESNEGRKAGGIMGKECRTCQRFDRRSGKCQVMKELIKDCWAWTDDKGWQRKVQKAVAEYKEIQGLTEGLHKGMV